MKQDVMSLIPALNGITVNPSAGFGVLGEGIHRVFIKQIVIVAGSQKLDLKNPDQNGMFPIIEKEGYRDSVPWENDGAQLAVVFANDEGQFTNYFTLLGYFSDLAELEKRQELLNDDRWLAMNELTPFKGKLQMKHFKAFDRSAEKYVCFSAKNQPVRRVINPENTEIATSIISNMLVAAGETSGTDFAEALQSCMDTVHDQEEQLEVKIQIAPREIADKVIADYQLDSNKKNQLRVVRIVPVDAHIDDLSAKASVADDNLDDLDDLI